MTTKRLMEELRQRVKGQPAEDRPAWRRTVAPDPLPTAPLPISAPRSAAGRSEKAKSRANPDAIQPQPQRAVQDPKLLASMKDATTAKLGVGRAGLRNRTQTLLQFWADYAVAQAAVESQIPPGWAEQQGYLPLCTEVADAEQYLTRPDLGRRLSAESLELVRQRCTKNPDVQIVIGDGISATAVEQNAPPMVDSLVAALEARGRSVGTPVFVRHCRAKIVDVVGQAVGAQVGIILVGERPGLGTGDGMSAYLVWDPRDERVDAEKQAISNIHRRGILPDDAGRHAAKVIEAILQQQTSGVKLDLSDLTQPASQRERVNQIHAEPLAGCGQSHGQQCEHSTHGLPGVICQRTDGRPCEASAH